MKRFLSILFALAIVFTMFSEFASADTIVYITDTGTKYHNAGCRYLNESCYSVSLSTAISRGLTPCSVCHAPSAPVSHTHTWDAGKVTTAATCSKAGVRTYTCTGCGQKRTESIPATGVHTWNGGQVTTAATCSKAGIRTYTCTGCGQKKTEMIPIDPNAHAWTCVDILTAPKDDQHGYGVFLCTICNKQKEDEVCPSSVFSDVKNDWSHKGIDFAVSRRITNGTDATHFSPSATCTRGQVVTFLWRAMGCPEPSSTRCPFVDVKESAYYFKAVQWAVEQNITNGIDATHFGPDKGCTRGQVVTFLWRSMIGRPLSEGFENPFVDVTGGYYYEAVLWAVGQNITKGTDNTHFEPNSTCTRAQIVTFLYRALT